MQEKIRQIVAEAREALEKADNTAALEALRVQFQGKKGSLTQLLRGMGQLSPEERPQMGALINAARENIGAMIDERRNALRAAEREAQLKRETIDVTEPRAFPADGHDTSAL